MRRVWTVLFLVFCPSFARLLAEPADTIQENRRLLASRDCESRVAGLRGLLDKVPPTERFDDAWACSDASYADPDTQHDAHAHPVVALGVSPRVIQPLASVAPPLALCELVLRREQRRGDPARTRIALRGS